jgi:hypothetical protein
MGDGNVETAPTSFAVPPPAAVAKKKPSYFSPSGTVCTPV